jgi:hypothetical protein
MPRRSAPFEIASSSGRPLIRGAQGVSEVRISSNRTRTSCASGEGQRSTNRSPFIASPLNELARHQFSSGVESKSTLSFPSEIQHPIPCNRNSSPFAAMPVLRIPPSVSYHLTLDISAYAGPEHTLSHPKSGAPRHKTRAGSRQRRWRAAGSRIRWTEPDETGALVFQYPARIGRA